MLCLSWLKLNRCLAPAQVAYMDGEGETDSGTPPATPPATPPPAGKKDDKLFTQEDLNKVVQDRLAKEQKRNEQRNQDLAKQYESLLATKNLSDEERTKMEESLEDVRKQLRTKDEQAKVDKKASEEKHAKEVAALTERVTKTETRYREEKIARALQDAAVAHEAYNPSQVVTLLRGHTKLVEATDDAGKPTGEMVVMVDFPDIDSDTKKPVLTQRTPEDAVKRMKELPEFHGNMFKPNIVSGLGSHSATGGLTPGAGGKLSNAQIAKLSMEQYAKIRKDNPELLGLK